MDNRANNSLTIKTFNALSWNAIGVISSQVISLFFGIVLARVLSPADYGNFAILFIFIGLSYIFVEGGFGAALIQKQEIFDIDKSTVFVFNILLSLIFYSILFVFSNFIASFFNNPNLTLLIRVASLVIILNAFSNIHNTLLIKELNYKRIGLYKIYSVIIAGIVGVTFAFLKFGVWALIYQVIAQSIAFNIFLWNNTDWIPNLKFSKKSFIRLFSFGSNLMIASLLYQIFSQSYSFIIGRLFPINNLGYYNRAENYQKMTSLSLTNLITSVIFPSQSKIQDNDKKLIQSTRKVLKITLLINTPLMFGFISVANPLINTLLTSKWLPMVIYFQWLCVAGLFLPLHGILMNLLKVKGKSGLYLKLVVTKKILIALSLFISYRYGIIGIVIGQSIISFLTYIIYGVIVGKQFKYNIINQLKDIYPFFALSFFIFLIINMFININDISSFNLVFLILIWVFGYFSIARVFKFDSLMELIVLIKKK